MTTTNPVRTAALWLAVVAVALLTLLVTARGYHRTAETPDVSRPSSTETRATVAADRGSAAAAVLLGQAGVQGERADSLAALLAAERSRTSTYRVMLASTRVRLDSVLVAVGVRLPSVSADTSNDGPDHTRADSDLNQLLAARILTERAAADAALYQCDVRAELASDVANAQAARATSAYAAADSALAALSYSRLAYVEADRRATTSAQLATRRTRQRNILFGTAAALAVGCTAALTLLR